MRSSHKRRARHWHPEHPDHRRERHWWRTLLHALTANQHHTFAHPGAWMLLNLTGRPISLLTDDCHLVEIPPASIPPATIHPHDPTVAGSLNGYPLVIASRAVAEHLPAPRSGVCLLVEQGVALLAGASRWDLFAVDESSALYGPGGAVAGYSRLLAWDSSAQINPNPFAPPEEEALRVGAEDLEGL